MKRQFDRDVSLNEALVEAIPTSVLITTVLCFALSPGFDDLRLLLIGASGSADEMMFYFTFTVSLLSAGFGLAKCLKVGPARNIGEGGTLDGFLGGRFLAVFLSSLLTLLYKTFLIVLTCEMVHNKMAIDMVQ